MKSEVRKNSLAFRMSLRIVRIIHRLEKFVFNRSLYVAVITALLFMTLPVVGVWFLFVFAMYLHPILRAVVIWSSTILLVSMAALVDYSRTQGF